MKQVATILWLLVCAHVSIFAQTPSWQWAVNPMGQCVVSAVCTDADNHVYITGHFLGAMNFSADSVNDNLGPYQNIFIAKFDAQGNVLWLRNAIGYADASGISADASENVYLTGEFYNDSVSFGGLVLTDPIPGNSNAFLTKYDSSGNVQWAENLGGPTNDYTYGVSTDLNNNIYVTGYFTGDSLSLGNTVLRQGGIDNVFVAKYNPAGNALWARSQGGAQYDGPNAICTDVFGNVYITGYFTSATMAFGSDTLKSPYAYSIFTTKYDSSGNVKWAKYGGNNYGNSSTGISADASGNVYVTGYYSDTIVFDNETLAGVGYQNVFTEKYGPSGTLLWAVSEQGGYVDQANAITTDAYGNAWIAGYFESDTAVFGANYLVNPAGTGNQVAFIAEYDPFGTAVWATAPGGTSSSAAVGVANSGDGIYVTGTYQNASILFGQDTLTQQNIFLAKLDTFVYTGIPAVKKLAGTIAVFPNPSDGNFYFEGLAPGCTLEIYNLLGQRLYCITAISDNYTVNMGDEANGVYLFRVDAGGIMIGQGKLVKE